MTSYDIFFVLLSSKAGNMLMQKNGHRLSLAHNLIWHIPYRFAECNPIKYLNLRDNLFKEFPRAVSYLIRLAIRCYPNQRADIPASSARNPRPEPQQAWPNSRRHQEHESATSFVPDV